MPFDRDKMKQVAAALAAEGVYIGTSSWKYQGWLGQFYTASKYPYKSKAAKFQGKVSEDRFEADCLSEYAEVFKTVCVDAAYYTFPRVEYLQGLADQVPDDFRFGFKVTDSITVKNFPNHPRHGAKARQPNSDFLNADLFATAFLKPCEAIRPKVGVLMFEFSHFWPSDYPRGRDFIADLDPFLSALPKGWSYAIELRNKNWLVPEYFGCLANHHITHVFNSWEGMPSVNEQMALPGSRTNPDLVAARFLLKPGRKYEQAVKKFEPYERVQEEYPEARAAGSELIAEALSAALRKLYIYLNNRLEGNALQTAEAIVEAYYQHVIKPQLEGRSR